MRRSRPFALAIAFTSMAFLFVLGLRGPQSADPQARLPERYRIADLIERQQRATTALRHEVERLRDEVADQRAAQADRTSAGRRQQRQLEELAAVTGLRELQGPGLRVTLDDSERDRPPEGASVNDLVVHSQDVQAVVNALWRADAEAISINGQRLVATSAVLCVGNTLLLNGTVHSPPYVVSAIGASRERFDSDRLVKRLRHASSAFGLRLDVSRSSGMTIPAYGGTIKTTYARPVVSPPS